MFDKDSDGVITTEELWTVMISLRQEATPDDIRDMITQVDIDGRNTLVFGFGNTLFIVTKNNLKKTLSFLCN